MSTIADDLQYRLIVLLLRSLELPLKLLYRYRVEGAENIPREGPYIAVMNEFSLLGTIMETVANLTLLKEPFLQRKTLYFVGEELWAVPWLRYNLTRMVPMAFPLLAHGAGMLGTSLLEGLRALERGWVVVINPEGDMSRDGRPLPLRGGAAWLALHSAAPLVPIVAGAGAYDAWPPWQRSPSLRGQIVHRVGKPFRLTERPVDRVTDEEIARGNAHLRAEIDRLWFGPGGMDAWSGPPLRDGKAVQEPVELGRGLEVAAPHRGAAPASSRRTRGIPQLLWRCPVCHTDDALAHRRPRFQAETLQCGACSTGWRVRRVMGRDFRLEVVAGPPHLIGLDMALSAWYDALVGRFQPEPVRAEDLVLQPGEEVYLRTSGARLVLYRSSPLFQGWSGREPPSKDLLVPSQAGDLRMLGTGELIVTDRRLVWEGPQGGLDFWWRRVTDIGLRLFFLLRVNYGVTPYRFTLGGESGLKWLTYAATLAQRVAAQEGRRVTASPF